MFRTSHFKPLTLLSVRYNLFLRSCHADWVLGLLWITGQLRVTESPDYLFPGYRVFHHAASAFYRYIEVVFPEKWPCREKKQFLASETV